jgi:hypothetical protein
MEINQTGIVSGYDSKKIELPSLTKERILANPESWPVGTKLITSRGTFNFILLADEDRTDEEIAQQIYYIRASRKLESGRWESRILVYSPLDQNIGDDTIFKVLGVEIAGN